MPLSVEQRLRDAARFRDELLWDAEREVERSRLAPTPPLQPQQTDSESRSRSDSRSDSRSNSDSDSDVSSGSSPKSGVLGEALKASGMPPSGGQQAIDRDDLYFQDGSILHDVEEKNAGGDTKTHALSSVSPDIPEEGNAAPAVSVVNISALPKASGKQRTEAMAQSSVTDAEAGRPNNSGAVISVTVQGVPVLSGGTTSTDDTKSIQQSINTGKGGQTTAEESEEESPTADSEQVAEKTTERHGGQPGMKDNFGSNAAGIDKEPVKETNGIGIIDAQNAVNAASEDNNAAGGHRARTSILKGKGIAEVTKSDGSKTPSSSANQKKQQLVARPNEEASDSQPTATLETSRSFVRPRAQDTDIPLVIARDPLRADQDPKEVNSTTSASSYDHLKDKQSEVGSSSTGNLTDDITAANSYLISDACRNAIRSGNSPVKTNNDRTEPANENQVNGTIPVKAPSGDSYLRSDACQDAVPSGMAHNATKSQTSVTGGVGRGQVNDTVSGEKVASADLYPNNDGNNKTAIIGRPQNITTNLGAENRVIGNMTSSGPPGKQAVEDAAYLSSDACRGAISAGKSQGRANSTGQKETTNRDVSNRRNDTEADSYLDSDACRHFASNGKPQEAVRSVGNATIDDSNDGTDSEVIASSPHPSGDRNRSSAVDRSRPITSEETVRTTPGKESASSAVEAITSSSGPTHGATTEGDIQATVAPLAIPPTSLISVSNTTSSSDSSPSYTESTQTSSSPSASLDFTQSPDPPSHPINAQSNISDVQNSSANLNILPGSASHLINSQDPSPNFTQPVAAAALFRRGSSPCQWRCRNLLSSLLLQVDPPRLLVAVGASVSVQCRLPVRRGVLARLSWSFRPAGGGECALTPAEGDGDGDAEARPRCDGFGDAAQLYFVNQTTTSSR